MGTAASTHTTSEIKELLTPEAPPCSVSGREQSDEDYVFVEVHDYWISNNEEEDESNNDEESDEEFENDSNDDDDEEEEDKEWIERLKILQDARNLRRVAEFFLHPEKPIAVDEATAYARCSYSRASAPMQTSPEEETDVGLVLADVQQMKMLAVHFLHPEEPVVPTGESTAFGRSYYSRPSAEQRDEEEDEELVRSVLEDAKKLRELATHYLHPENPAVTTDSTVFGRNYFGRASAEEFEQDEEAQEKSRILEDMKQMKKFAVQYNHLANPVVLSEATAYGRNYFSRASAEQYDDEIHATERSRFLEEAKELKKLATMYAHPENLIIATDSTTFARNYFGRASAAEQIIEEEDEAEERTRIFEETHELKKLALAYYHPENPPTTDDAAVFGRNYFSRPSAEQHEDEEDAAERAFILEEAKDLKKLAIAHGHPENAVVTDATAFARNYFNRASAGECVEEEEDEERARILEEMQELKKFAVVYAHPEIPVSIEGTAFGSNYFSRPSAEYYDDEKQAQEKALILEDARELKKLAAGYSHPENPITTEATTYGRNYFSRASADKQDVKAEAVERARVIEEAQELKKLAVQYNHPENPVSTDAAAYGRNYFSRASFEGYEEEEAEEKTRILMETQKLKTLAIAYAHPENPVSTPDSTAFGRDYFSRASAEEYDDEAQTEERALVLEDMKQLKKSATEYLHPENPVTTDAAAFGRNYFSRASAEEYDDEDERGERAGIINEARELKKLAIAYALPENTVDAEAAVFGRNYFGRASAEQYDDDVEGAEERTRILEDAQELKKLAIGYNHPESPVATEATVFGRNYFSRSSAEANDDEEKAEERVRTLDEAQELKRLAIAYNYPEQPVSTDATAFARNYFSRASSNDCDNEDEEERVHVLEDSKQLKDLAIYYLHPEKPVVTSDSCATGRNYFMRASAAEQLVQVAPAEPNGVYSVPIISRKATEAKASSMIQFKGQPPKVAYTGEKEKDQHLHKSPSAIMVFDMNDSDMIY